MPLVCNRKILQKKAGLAQGNYSAIEAQERDQSEIEC